MPSPFPGMDPYIETCHLWESFHADLISQIALVLNQTLPRDLVARSESRCYIVPPSRSVTPDVVIKQRVAAGHTGFAERERERASATIPGEPTGVIRLVSEEIRERYIEIQSLSAADAVVTVIEVLSPANKAPGNPGRETYFRKQTDVLDSSANLVEIDLLRAGAHTVAVPFNQLEPWGKWDYIVSLHRAAEADAFPFYLNNLHTALPVIQIPLGGLYTDILLDMQSVVNYCYDGWRYGDSIDYGRDVLPPLATDDIAWVEHLLRERGGRR